MATAGAAIVLILFVVGIIVLIAMAITLELVTFDNVIAAIIVFAFLVAVGDAYLEKTSPPSDYGDVGAHDYWDR